MKFDNSKYVGDPVNAIKIFNDKQCDELIVLDTVASKENKGINFGLIGEITSECFMPLVYGGGITKAEEIEKLLKLGVEKVSLNSVLFTNPAFLAEAVKSFGSSTIVASVDVTKNFMGKYRLFSHSGKKTGEKSLPDFLQWLNDINPGEVMINLVDNDGTMKGYDLNLAAMVSSSLSMPVVFCGGCRDFEDIRKLLTTSEVSAAAAGSFFVYHGPHRAVLISYPSPGEISSIYKAAS